MSLSGTEAVVVSKDRLVDTVIGIPQSSHPEESARAPSRLSLRGASDEERRRHEQLHRYSIVQNHGTVRYTLEYHDR